MGVCDRHSITKYKMELRSYNVERVYKDCVKCRIGDSIGVDKEQLERHKEDIKSMCSQIAHYNGWTLLATANIRTDGEVWTPYMQIIEMLILLGVKIEVLRLEIDKNNRQISKVYFNDETN